MAKQILVGLVILAAALIVYSFFLPWANVSTSAVGVSKELTAMADSNLKDTPFAGKVVSKLKQVTGVISDLGDIKLKTSVSGYNIPRLVNDKTSKVALSIVQIMFKSAEGIDVKSYLVYLLPISAIACVVLAIGGLKKKILIVVMLALSGVIAGFGLYNLYTMDVSSIAVKIDIAKGLWNTMYAFLFIFVMSIIWLRLDNKKS